MADRRYKLIKQGLPGERDFEERDLQEGTLPIWDAATEAWTRALGIECAAGVYDTFTDTTYTTKGVTSITTPTASTMSVKPVFSWADSTAGRNSIVALASMSAAAAIAYTVVVSGTNDVIFDFRVAADNTTTTGTVRFFIMRLT